MEVRRILSQVSGMVTWQILRLMINRDYTAEQLAETLDVTRSTARSHIGKLREAGFVDATKTSRPKRYGLVDEFPGAVHEIVMLFVSLDTSTNIYDSEQVQKQLESMRPTFGDSDWFENLVDILMKNYPHPGLTRKRSD